MLTIPVPSGQPSFLDSPRCDDFATLEADFAIIGVPYGYSYTMNAVSSPSGPAPAAIREASCGFFHGDITQEHYDFDLVGPVFAGQAIRVVDCGDVAMTPGAFAENSATTTAAIAAILERGAIPIVLGGDHAIPIPVMRAYEGRGAMVVVQIDAHIDWREERYGVREGLSSPMRRASELSCVTGMAQIGMRGIGSARPAEVRDALAFGSVIVPAAEVHAHGVEAVLDKIPAAESYYITFDADGLDAAVAPAVLDPGYGGLTFNEVSDILRSVAMKGQVVGYDIVEVVPALDTHGLTSRCVARLTLTLMGAIVRARG